MNSLKGPCRHVGGHSFMVIKNFPDYCQRFFHFFGRGAVSNGKIIRTIINITENEAVRAAGLIYKDLRMNGLLLDK